MRQDNSVTKTLNLQTTDPPPLLCHWHRYYKNYILWIFFRICFSLYESRTSFSAQFTQLWLPKSRYFTH